MKACSLSIEALQTGVLVVVAIVWAIVAWSYTRWTATHWRELQCLVIGRLPCAVAWTSAVIVVTSAYYALARPLRTCLGVDLWSYVHVTWALQALMLIAGFLMLPPYWKTKGRRTRKWLPGTVVVLSIVYAGVVWVFW